jgi:hypothetical protein
VLQLLLLVLLLLLLLPPAREASGALRFGAICLAMDV